MKKPCSVPIPVKEVLHVQLVYIGNFTEDERAWLKSRSVAFGVEEAMCPGIVEALSARRPFSKLSVCFARSDGEATEIVCKKQDEFGADLITQPGWAKLAHPLKGTQRYEFQLDFHMENLSGEVPGKVTLVGPRHPLYPET